MLIVPPLCVLFIYTFVLWWQVSHLKMPIHSNDKHTQGQELKKSKAVMPDAGVKDDKQPAGLQPDVA
jgi:hypothetical protein